MTQIKFLSIMDEILKTFKSFITSVKIFSHFFEFFFTLKYFNVLWIKKDDAYWTLPVSTLNWSFHNIMHKVASRTRTSPARMLAFLLLVKFFFCSWLQSDDKLFYVVGGHLKINQLDMSHLFLASSIAWCCLHINVVNIFNFCTHLVFFFTLTCVVLSNL